MSVVLSHTSSIYGFNVAEGIIAVECFFIISGFHMSLILNEKYVGPGSTWMFYSGSSRWNWRFSAPGVLRTRATGH